MPSGEWESGLEAPPAAAAAPVEGETVLRERRGGAGRVSDLMVLAQQVAATIGRVGHLETDVAAIKAWKGETIAALAAIETHLGRQDLLGQDTSTSVNEVKVAMLTVKDALDAQLAQGTASALLVTALTAKQENILLDQQALTAAQAPILAHAEGVMLDDQRHQRKLGDMVDAIRALLRVAAGVAVGLVGSLVLYGLINLGSSPAATKQATSALAIAGFLALVLGVSYVFWGWKREPPRA